MRKMRYVLLLILVGIVIFSLAGCTGNEEDRQATEDVSDTVHEDMSSTARNFKRLYTASPPPELSQSVERQNLIKRLERFNVADKISYIYLINYGKIMAFFTVQGKVSSVNSTLTTPDQIVHDSYDDGHGENDEHVMASPQLDGSYGENGNAIFFFTDKDIYVEWNGTYLLTDQYIELETPPQLVQTTE